MQWVLLVQPAGVHSSDTESLEVTYVRALQTLELLAQSFVAEVSQLSINVVVKWIAEVGMDLFEVRYDDVRALGEVSRIELRETRRETRATRCSASRKLASLKLLLQASEVCRDVGQVGIAQVVEMGDGVVGQHGNLVPIAT